MARTSARRPLPALVFLLALSLLTGLVWWRVIHRGGDHSSASPATTCPAEPSGVVLPQPSAVSVTVLNSTQTSGLAHTVAGELHADGFKIAKYGNDTSGTVSGVAEIRFGTAGRAAATLMSYYLPGAALVPVARSGASIEVSLGEKFKALTSQTQAKAAMRSAHVRQSAPGAHKPSPPKTTPSRTVTSHPSSSTKTAKAATKTPGC